jgi:cytochrome c-type biogenesis protein CcmF
MKIEYVGEHLLPGHIGQFLVIIAFVTALLSGISYFFSSKNPFDASWKALARTSFFIHMSSIYGIIAVIFYLILNHRYEYHYAWEHSSNALPLRYILSCFWEGQEGSFLLWAFWHTILSVFIIRKKGEWEAPVMSVIAIVQVFLCSMLFGIYFFGYKIGSSPFILLRDHPDFANLPFIKSPDYLGMIKDGRGLNPLLQNYWMTIHPPTLFLGFASTVIPFAFAIGGLMTKRLSEWVKPALPWAFFAVMILGTGVLMGAAWAYESLTFGGFWAWDPVENSSLVPWLVLVGAAHVMLIYKHNGQSLLTSYLLCIASFLLVLYSTFLTRSGILGDASVHAFTDLGMSGQLLVYMAFFVLLAIVLLVINWKKIPLSKQEESTYSREFWMFIGSLVLLISAFQILFDTSIPVVNKVFGSTLAPSKIEHYNAWQLPIAVIIAILVAIGQHFKYKNTEVKEFLKKIAPSFIIAIIMAIVMTVGLEMYFIHYFALLFAASFAITANFDFMIRVIKGRIKHSGASIAHIGFGFLLLGVLISNAKKETISKTLSQINLGKDFPNNENILLNKGDTLMMGEYFISYRGKEKEGVNIYYEVEYYKRDLKTGMLKKDFSLKPIVQTNPRMGNVSEPDTRHFLNKDIYTHVTYAELEDRKENENDDYNKPQTKSVAVGDTVVTSNSLVIFKELNKNIDKSKLGLNTVDIAVGAQLEVFDVNKNNYKAEPVFVIQNSEVYTSEAKVEELGLKIGFNKIDPSTGKIDLVISEKKSNSREFIIMKAIIFPYINLLWIGCILLIIGTTLSIRKRISAAKGNN